MAAVRLSGRTLSHPLMTSLTETYSAEVRDMIIATGMEAGMQDAYELLEEVAISLA